MSGCGSGAVFAESFARTLRERFYYFGASVFGYTESVTSPERNNDNGYEGHKLAVNHLGEILGRASEFRQPFKGY